MATNSKVFVSPGVYTSEVDLSFVAQSVGVTTLGIVGETLKGPAFEPIFITNFDEFTSYFGGTSPEKFVNTQIPKYEASYIAKSYLQQSNQLFVTRILGLSGYDAGPSWSILTKANVDKSTVDFYCESATTVDCVTECVDFKTIDFAIDFSGCTNSIDGITFLDPTQFPDEIATKLYLPYENFDNSISTLNTDIKLQIFNILNEPSTELSSINYYGTIPYSAYVGLSAFTGSTNVFDVDGIDSLSADYTDPKNDSWYYALFDNVGNSVYSGYSFWSIVTDLTLVPIITTTTIAPTTIAPTTTNPCVTPVPTTTTTTTTAKPVHCYTGTLMGRIYVYSGTAYTDYDDLVIATMRSRGLATYGTDDGAVYEVSGLTDVEMVCTGGYSGVTKNPFSTFGLNVTKSDGTNLFFETSLSSSDSKYLSKVFGKSNFGKDKESVPLFIEESYATLLINAYRKGYIRGLNCELNALDSARSESTSSIGFYLEKYQSPSSPWVVSELRGSKVFNLFKFITISDGNDANTEVKISIANISFNNGTFDVLVRDFFDTDNNPVVIEKFTNCNMNPGDNNFIGKKVGTSDGEYQLNSKYVMVELNEDAPIDALPCGFQGYTTREYAGSRSPFPLIKSKYDYPGEVVFDPPFGLSTGSNAVSTSPGDNVRRTYLGISNTVGIDTDFYQYKGKQIPNTSLCDAITGPEWSYRTKGFHMDKNASVITIPNSFVTSGTPEFVCGDAEFTSDPDNESNPYYRLYARKFSFLVGGGFDGWDIYREYRTNSDRYVLGRTGYLKGSCPTLKYPTATGWGAFKQITVGQNRVDYANTDYYAYLLGIQTFSNPEAVNINVFVTPGIDYVNNSDLVGSAIEMIEFNRADSVYITTTPDYNMFTPSLGDPTDLIYPQEAVDNLETSGIDSNYTATYYPWILVRDTVNNTQIYLPPTGEVTKNLALTDNVAFPWFAAAGYTRGIVSSIKARKKLTQEDRDVLYKGRINPIATFSDVGTVIWGNKTLQIKESALDRINVRRLLLQARKLISAVSVRLLFEQNDEKVRQDFLNAVNPILDGIRRDRGLYDFRVSVSSDSADLDRNQMTGKIYIKPTKSLEFIDITFYITPTGASFENI
jgi:hypothetical protein